MSATDELRSFLDEHLPAFRQKHGDDPSFEARREWQSIMQGGRWVAPTWAEEHGGRGMDVLTALECSEVLAEYNAPAVAGIFGVANVGPTIAHYGTDDQKRHLVPILDASELWCQGFSEPGTGSDLAGLRTRAVLDGDEFVIDGQKIWTSDGMRADFMELLVRTDPDAPKHRGISALLIPMDLSGIERRPITQITGGSDFAEVFFSGVRVPKSSLLGPLDEGWGVTMTTLSHERTGVVSAASGAVRAIASLVDEVRGDEGVRGAQLDELLQRYVEGQVMGALGERSLQTIKSTGQPGPEQSIIKLEWSLLNQRLASTRLALAGPQGVASPSDDGDATFGYLQSRSATIAGGTTEILKNILAKRVLGLPD